MKTRKTCKHVNMKTVQSDRERKVDAKGKVLSHRFIIMIIVQTASISIYSVKCLGGELSASFASTHFD